MDSVIEYFRRRGEALKELVLPKQLSPYQAHRAENAALIGDRLLDVYLYRSMNIHQEEADVTDRATQQRSKILSNYNLAQLGAELYPLVMEINQWERLSDAERGTFVEALVGGMYLEEGFKCTPQFELVVQEMLQRLMELASSGPTKSPISLLLEWFQSKGVKQPQQRLGTTTVGPQTFQTIVDLSLEGPPRLVMGQLGPSKDAARLSAAERALKELGLNQDLKETPIRRIAPPPPAPIGAETLVRDGSFNHEVPLKEMNREKTLSWYQRKREKDPWQICHLLSAHLERAIEVAGWVGYLEETHVAVITAAFRGDRYWGFGASAESRNKSKVAAAQALHVRAPFEAWIQAIMP